MAWHRLPGSLDSRGGSLLLLLTVLLYGTVERVCFAFCNAIDPSENLIDPQLPRALLGTVLISIVVCSRERKRDREQPGRNASAAHATGPKIEEFRNVGPLAISGPIWV